NSFVIKARGQSCHNLMPFVIEERGMKCCHQTSIIVKARDMNYYVECHYFHKFIKIDVNGFNNYSGSLVVDFISL
nr:hypothetical protein [Tanacetum cinerariifolium]